uniref:response regulator transcription factor n=1 Tax=uncultured Caulobacter sp. TaxID=158749 RepID=UPI0025D03336|nr:response regulator transcription factor [uncultured Caulobacter sp.]
MKRVLVVESQPLMRAAIVRLLETAWPKASIVEAGSLAGVEAACRSGHVGLVILEPALPDATGLGALVAIQRRLPDAPVVVYTARRDDQVITSSNALGAAGYVHKSAQIDELLAVLRAAAAGARSFPSLNGAVTADQEIAAMRKRLSSLTATQMKVLMSVADGRLNKQVAADFNVSEAAIKAHLTGIFRKLGVHNRTQAMLALQPVLGAALAA